MKTIAMFLIFAAFPWIGLAAGADHSFYVTAKLAETSVDRTIELGPFDSLAEDDDGWSAGFGYNFNRRLAVQAEYLTLGEVIHNRICGPPDSLCLSPPPLVIETEALSLTAVGRVQLGPRASAFGKAGLARLETNALSLGTRESGSDSLEGHFGAGLAFRVWRQLSVLAEYETVGGEVDSLSFGARFDF